MALRIDNQTNCINGTGTLRSESVAHGRTDVRCEHHQIVTQLSHRKVDSLLLRMASINVGTLRGRAGEIVEMLERRSVDVCCVQEVRWRGASVRFVEGRRARYKLFWIGNSTGYGGVGIFIAEKWIDKVIDVKRVNDHIIVVKFLIGKKIVTAVSVYTAQCGLSEEEKDKFYDELIAVTSKFGDNELVIVGGDFNGHIGSRLKVMKDCTVALVLGVEIRKGRNCLSLEQQQIW